MNSAPKNNVIQQDINILSELKAEINSRLQFVTTIAIFFTVLLQMFFNVAASDANKGNEMLLFWSVLVGIYIASYTVFQLFKGAYHAWTLRTLNWLLLAAIANFVIPVYVFATIYHAKTYSAPVGWMFMITTWGILIIPIVVLLFALFVGCYLFGNKIATPTQKNAS